MSLHTHPGYSNQRFDPSVQRPNIPGSAYPSELQKSGETAHYTKRNFNKNRNAIAHVTYVITKFIFIATI